MAIGLAIYGMDTVSPVLVFELARSFFDNLNCQVTSAGYYKRQTLDGVDDIVLDEVSQNDMCVKLQDGTACDFRLFSENEESRPWFASFGLTSGKFGSFDCIDAQSDESYEGACEKYLDFLKVAAEVVSFKYAIVYEAKNVSGAMWYARGENLTTLFDFESPVAFVHSTPGCDPGGREYEGKMLRMVYSINFLSDEHLSIIVNNVSLCEWISAGEGRGQLEKSSRGWCWRVAADCLRSVNKACGEAGVLIAWKRGESKRKAGRLP